MITQETDHFFSKIIKIIKISIRKYHLTSEDEEYVKTEQYSVYKITLLLRNN